MRGRHLAARIVVDGCHETSLGSALCHLSEDAPRPKGGRLEDLRDHVEWRCT